MKKKLDKMSLFELAELKNILKGLVANYDAKLQTYSVLQDDKFFEKISDVEASHFDKKRKLNNLIMEVETLMENIVFNEVIKEGKA